MREIDLTIPPTAAFDHADMLVETCCHALGLRQTLKGTLKQYPGCVHWHYQRGTEKGTLEITLWREKRRLWFKLSSGRQGAWIEQTVEELRVVRETALKQ